MIRQMSHLLQQAGVRTAAAVGTMWCAVVFIVLGVLSAPGVATGWVNDWANWLDQALLPLVLMPVLLVGSNLASDIVAGLVKETHDHTIQMHADSLAALANVTAIANALHVHITGDQYEQAGAPDDR